MKTPATLLAEALDHTEEALRTVWQSQPALTKTGQNMDQVVNALERVRQLLAQVQRQHLEFLGIPGDYMRTMRIRLGKEALSWKLWLPTILVGIVTIEIWPIFSPPSQVEIGFLGAGITLPRRIFAVILIVILLAVHEGLHALPLLLIGRNKPGFKLRFGFFSLGAYATGNCVLSRPQSLIVSLAPLTGITVVGGLLWVLVPSLAPWLYFVIMINVAGSWGDLHYSWLLIQAHPQALSLDTDYEMAIFEPRLRAPSAS